MEVVRLNQDLFNKDKLKGKEISNNKNGSRPHYYSFKRNDNRVCIPFRTNTKMVPDKYKIKLGHEQPSKPHSAIDLTKAIVINNDEYLKNKNKANIPQNVNNYLKDQVPNIERKYDVMTQDYIEAKSKLSDVPLVKYSTMQYFHKELNIQNTIDNKQTQNAINELTSNGITNTYTNLKDPLPNNAKTLLDDYETLNEFKNLTEYPAKINYSDINNPFLDIEKNDKQFKLYANSIKNEPERHMRDFLDYDIKSENKIDSELDL